VRNAYIYPISAKIEKDTSYNPYMDDFIESMSTGFNFINRDNPSTTGIFDLLKYVFQTDYVFFNWAEDIPDKKYGLAQVMFLLIFLNIAKFCNIKIIWTMHNKLSHSRENLLLKRVIFYVLLKKSNSIITHASEGILYAEDIVTGSKKKVIYITHPVKSKIINHATKKSIDILIWGSLSQYKGIIEFLEYLFSVKLENTYEILIIGKSTSQKFFDSLSAYSNEHIVIRDYFPNEDYLGSLISQSKVVLFTYAKSSILSSGALMDSIGFGAKIIGPNVGAFSDIKKEGIVETYDTFDDLIETLNIGLDISCSALKDDKRIEFFLRDNSWGAFAEKLCNSIALL
jgi:glycosyltransferase involved in cell wall biosynthesis